MTMITDHNSRRIISTMRGTTFSIDVVRLDGKKADRWLCATRGMRMDLDDLAAEGATLKEALAKLADYIDKTVAFVPVLFLVSQHFDPPTSVLINPFHEIPLPSCKELILRGTGCVTCEGGERCGLENPCLPRLCFLSIFRWNLCKMPTRLSKI